MIDGEVKIEWDTFITGIEEKESRVKVAGIDHIVTAWSDLLGEELYLHLDANNKVVTIMAGSGNSRKAQEWAKEYVSDTGLTYEQLHANTLDYHSRWKTAWREQFPEEAVEWDRQRVAALTAQLKEIRTQPQFDKW